MKLERKQGSAYTLWVDTRMLSPALSTALSLRADYTDPDGITGTLAATVVPNQPSYLAFTMPAVTNTKPGDWRFEVVADFGAGIVYITVETIVVTVRPRFFVPQY